jgi:ribonuclease T1
MGQLKKLALFFVLSLFLAIPFAQARSQPASEAAALSTIAVAELPPEARTTLQLIKSNGPFPYPKDGTVFGNYERILPLQARGYYHEYTVITPGVRHRGARRIVCGVVPECYYSADHYRSFYRIVEGR